MPLPQLNLRDLRRSDLPEGRYDLNRSPVRIGRGPRCEIRLHTDRIADVQVILRREGDRWLVHPVGPPEGSILNGQPMTETAWLDYGTTLLIGHVEIKLDHAGSGVLESPATIVPVPALEPIALESVTDPDPEPVTEPEPEAVYQSPEVVVAEVVAEMPEPLVLEAEPVVDSVPEPVEVVEPEQPAYLSTVPSIHHRLPNLAAPVSAIPVVALSETFSSAEIRRQTPRLNSHRTTVPAVDRRESLDQWANDFSRRHRTTKPRNLDTASNLSAGMAYQPRPIPTMLRSNHMADLELGRFIEPAEEICATLKASTVVEIPEVSVQQTVVIPVSVIAESITQVDTDDFQDDQITEIEAQVFEPVESELEDPEVVAYSSYTTEEMAVLEDLTDDFPEHGADCDQADELESLGVAQEKKTPEYLTESLSVSQFEEWLGNVGTILEPVQTETSSFEVVDSVAPDQEADDQELDLESESVEILIPPVAYLEASEPIQTALVRPITEMNQADEASEVHDSADEKSLNEWPSVHDILRWSAVRETQYGDPEQVLHSHSESKEHVIEPKQMVRMNVPAAMALCVVWLGGSAMLAMAAYRISSQDELTQQAVSAVMVANQAGGAPRLPAKQMAKIQDTPAWWAISGDQIWWRATFMKMRETAGQPATIPGETLAELARERDPILPAARLWNVSRPAITATEAEWSGLSRDVVSLMTSADHFRRIGDEQKANSADKTALELATALDRSFNQKTVVFDAELGTGRFLLPGQNEVLVILKRLVKEPNGAEIIMKVLPEDRPEVWLTAAQIMKQSAVGDPAPLLEKLLAWKTPGRASINRHHLEQAVRAEALALNGSGSEAADAYKMLTQAAPDSVWKRSWFFNHGSLSSQIQKGEAAIVSWRKARGEDPNHEVDRHAIQASRSLTGNLGDASAKNAPLRTN